MSFLTVVTLLCLISYCQQHVVTIVQGQLRGMLHDGLVSYVGVPYASVRSGADKFKQAGLAPSWKGIREPKKSKCSASSPVDECLMLDVHVPARDSAQAAVLVWVTGNGRNYNPSKLQREIMVVVVYHRVGATGFLCLGVEEIPGNVGAKDVVVALRWVRDNIVAFGGNPAKVTVAGQGFGAAIVEALTVSGMARGLFHGVILQSGTILSPCAFNYDAQERARTIEKMFGEDMLSGLVNATIDNLAIQSEKLVVPYFPFAMCLEKAFKKQERFISEAPIDLLTEKLTEVPMMIGYNNDEAYIFVSNFKQNHILNFLPKHLSIILPAEFKTLNDREINLLNKQINNTYFNSNFNMEQLLEFHRDAYFLSHIYRSVRRHSSNSRLAVYFYQFSHSGAVGVEPESGVVKTGAAHSDELAYLFPKSERDFKDDDAVVQENLIKLWTNFVIYLNPTPFEHELIHWEPTPSNSLRLLDISSTLEMKDFPHTETAEMWDDVYQKYYYTRQNKRKIN